MHTDRKRAGGAGARFGYCGSAMLCRDADGEIGCLACARPHSYSPIAAEAAVAAGILRDLGAPGGDRAGRPRRRFA